MAQDILLESGSSLLTEAGDALLLEWLYPYNLVAPAASGTTLVGETITCTTGSWTGTPSSYAYQWQRDALGDGIYSNLLGETASTLLLELLDAGCRVRCMVTATNEFGDGTANSNALGPISITGPIRRRYDSPAIRAKAWTTGPDSFEVEMEFPFIPATGQEEAVCEMLRGLYPEITVTDL